MADPVEVSKDSLDLMLLYIVSRGPAPGYAMGKFIGECSAGAFRIGHVRLLYALHRLEKRKFIRSEWRVTKTRRIGKFYQLTALGTSYLGTTKDQWAQFATSMAVIFATKPDLETMGATALIHDGPKAEASGY